ncbi:MAG: folate-binding protein [Wolbachia endosymbiont of Meromenopon meropis]|nr:folate-binding protein [Wolbachia endosymbiont of Meromenopon meropis]
MSYIPLQNRSVMILYGLDVRNFLQNIITNDVNKLNEQKAIYSLLLNPQGKYLYDFFLIRYDKYIMLECADTHLQQIIEQLNLLKTYMKVKIKDISSLYKVGALLNAKSVESVENNKSQIIFPDPRHKSLGMRIIHKGEIKQPIENFIQYEKVRIQNLIPDGVKDMIQNSSFPLQYLIDKVNGISFSKGCYIGQEVVNRMSRQKIFRKKLYLVRGNDTLPNIGTKIINDSNEEVGELRSSVDNIGLALLCTNKNYTNLYSAGIKISSY